MALPLTQAVQGPLPHAHARAEIRIEIDADAVFALAKPPRPPRRLFRRRARQPRPLGRGRVRNISAGGVEISHPKPRLKPGSRVLLGVVTGDTRLGPLQAEVVRETRAGAGLRFVEVDEATRLALLQELSRL